MEIDSKTESAAPSQGGQLNQTGIPKHIDYGKDSKPTSAPGVVKKFDSNKITYRTKLAVETGYVESNAWLDQMSQYANQSGQRDCLICTGARPALTLVKTAFEEYKNASVTPGSDLGCLTILMSRENPTRRCAEWEKIFPMAASNVTPPVFRHSKVHDVTCFENNNTAGRARQLGRLSECERTVTLTGMKLATQLTVSRADVWWYCGGRILYNWLPHNWEVGVCINR